MKLFCLLDSKTLCFLVSNLLASDIWAQTILGQWQQDRLYCYNSSNKEIYSTKLFNVPGIKTQPQVELTFSKVPSESSKSSQIRIFKSVKETSCSNFLNSNQKRFLISSKFDLNLQTTSNEGQYVLTPSSSANKPLVKTEFNKELLTSCMPVYEMALLMIFTPFANPNYFEKEAQRTYFVQTEVEQSRMSLVFKEPATCGNDWLVITFNKM